MRTVRIVGTAIITSDAGRNEVAKKVWPEQNVMKLSQCRAWVTRTFNKLRADLGPNEALRVTFSGGLSEHPFSHYGGGIRGTSRLVIREGDMD